MTNGGKNDKGKISGAGTPGDKRKGAGSASTKARAADQGAKRPAPPPESPAKAPAAGKAASEKPKPGEKPQSGEKSKSGATPPPAAKAQKVAPTRPEQPQASDKSAANPPAAAKPAASAGSAQPPAQPGAATPSKPRETSPSSPQPAAAPPSPPSKPAAPQPPTSAQPTPTKPEPTKPAATPAPPPKPQPAPAKPLPPLASDADIHAVVDANHRDPFGFLGMHALTPEGDLVVRAFLPEAREVAIIDAESGARVAAMQRLHEAGLFAGAVSGRPAPFRYRLAVVTDAGDSVIDDAYRFPPLLGDEDTRLLREGQHWHAYTRLGAHPALVDGIAGVSFAVWAPNAFRVAVVGDFNGWDGRCHGMRLRHDCGVWEIFVPAATAAQLYKYEIKTAADARPILKIDPLAFQAERWPGTASIVADPDRYRWGDRVWMQARKDRQHAKEPMSIYEVHLGSWRRKPEEDARWLTYEEFADELPGYVKEMGFTHVELLPVSEFNFEGSLGYHPTALFAPTGRFGDPDGLRRLIDRCHQAGIGVILNWVAVQFPDEAEGLARFDGTVLYEHPDPRQQRHPIWNTLIYNYGSPQVANFLISNALFWLKEYHVDGLRIDGLASILYLDYGRGPGQWSHNRYGGHENLEAIDFLRQLNETVSRELPGTFTVAEEESGWPMVSRPTFVGGLGFGFKWNEAWLNETLRYMARNPIHRKYYHEELTHGPSYVFQENYITPLSHGLVSGGKGPLIGRMPGSHWDKCANLRLFYALMYAQPGKKLLFMGNEFAQYREWNHEISLDWHMLDDPLHKGMQTLIADLNTVYAATPALHEGDCAENGFAWIDSNDTDQSVISFLRFGAEDRRVATVICNFTPVVRQGYRIGVPYEGYYTERLNTDAARYGGSNVGNAGGVWADAEPMHGRPCSLPVVLPPYAAVILEYTGTKPATTDDVAESSALTT
ncbi:MAG: 1,4-alpha-glucan branching protein GlgB [Rhodospirillales bacterium]|nr:MAG: 1,4-alpha-glucan branching protein GlgB [Rhodospirillales bacterium]